MKLSKHAKFRAEKFGGVLFETHSEKVFALNPTAAAIVHEIGGECDQRALTERMKQRFEGIGGAIEHEVGAFLAQLRQLGLLED